MMNRKQFVLGLGSLFAVTAQAQFTGPGVAAPASTVAQLREVRISAIVDAHFSLIVDAVSA